MRRSTAASRHATILAGPLLASVLVGGGCETISDDFNDLMQGISPPSPFEAAVWAADFNEPGRQRQGVVLLSNATFGGERPYMELYASLVEDSPDPLVQAAAIRALGRWGGPDEARLIAERLESEFVPVRLESAIALQRIHEPAIADAIWQGLVKEDEEETVRIELAIALGQYASDASFQALCLALDDRSLALNLAAADSLRILTGRDFGLDRPTWLSWYDATDAAFKGQVTFLYPTFRRTIGFWESLAFWDPTTFEEPAAPRGLLQARRTTYTETPPSTEKSAEAPSVDGSTRSGDDSDP